MLYSQINKLLLRLALGATQLTSAMEQTQETIETKGLLEKRDRAQKPMFEYCLCNSVEENVEKLSGKDKLRYEEMHKSE